MVKFKRNILALLFVLAMVLLIAIEVVRNGPSLSNAARQTNLNGNSASSSISIGQKSSDTSENPGYSSSSVEQPATPPAPVPRPILTTTTPLWGAYVGDDKTDLDNFEALVGKKVDLFANFESFENDFPLSLSAEVGERGKTLVIFWEPNFGYDKILDGSKDSYIRSFASDASRYHFPVILVPFDEMNLNEAAWGFGQNGNTAGKFILSWRYVHNLFAVAPNVKFGIAFNNVSIPDQVGNDYSDYYPGDSYVDYVGVDGFNFGDPWQDFGQVFDAAINKVAVFNKPIYIFSTATTDGSQKANWITDGLGADIYHYPNLKGWVWFNGKDQHSWPVDSNKASLQAFKSIIPSNNSR